MTMDEAKLMATTYAEKTHEEIIRAAAAVVADAALRLIEADPHQFGKRPCQTCAAVSALINRPFGCLRFNDLATAKFPRGD